MSGLWPVDDAYTEINAILERWAERNQLSCQTEYKGYSVRSHSLPLGDADSVQFWVDKPERGAVTIRVAVNSQSKKRRRSQKASFPLDDLEAGLDEALRTAREWALPAN